MTAKATLGEPDAPAPSSVQDNTEVYGSVGSGSDALVNRIIAENLQASKLSVSRNDR